MIQHNKLNTSPHAEGRPVSGSDTLNQEKGHSVTFSPASCRGEAAVTQGGKEVNRLFKADFFGERALLSNEPRGATVSAVQDTVCLTLDRDTFVEILGPMDSAMKVCGWGHL